MNIFSAILSAIVFGALIGAIARLILPGRQNIGWLKTVGIGIGAAFIGTIVAQIFGVASTDNIDWIQWGLQIGFAIIGILFFAGTTLRRD